MISAKIIADSISQNAHRITTFVITYPRFILAEFNTHRMLSRNSASSRAIPVTKILKDITDNPAKPEYWGKNQKGMQADEELSQEQITEVERVWLEARDSAILHAKKLLELGVHKQITNRILEPWCHITTIVTATEWENFFALRAHKDAQPEFRVLAEKMLSIYNENTPKLLNKKEWHIPFGDQYLDENLTTEQKLKIGTARCARVSYLNFEGDIDHQKDYDLHDGLLASGHLSPFEHCARPSGFFGPDDTGNFRGWLPYRKLFKNENRTDSRVVKGRS